jgi:hypothetical protein
MMTRWLMLLSVLVLSGCVSREDADAKLARGCAAGAELFLEEGYKIKEIKDKIFRDDPELGRGYREVRLFVVESDGWYDADQEYKCIFEETMGPFGMSHAATIHQLKMHDQTWGKEGDKIVGSFDDHLKLTETVEQGMNR